MRHRHDLGSIFVLILIIAGAAYLFGNWSGPAARPQYVVRSAGKLTGRLIETGGHVERVSGLLATVPVSWLAAGMNLFTGYPEKPLNEARTDFSEAKTLVPSLQYYALKCASIGEQKLRLTTQMGRLEKISERNLLARYANAADKELDTTRRAYEGVFTEISSKMKGARSALKCAVMAFAGALFTAACLGGVGGYVLVISLPKLKRPKDEVLDLRIDEVDVPNNISLSRGNPEKVPVYRTLEERRLLSQTARALLGILAAHPEWPASIEGHSRSELGLIQHTGNTVLLVLDKLPEEIDAGAAVTAALAHDIGKILAYRRGTGGQWVTTGLYHDRLSATILLSLPEFHQEFQGEPKAAVTAAVRYHHALADMPVNSGPLSRKLFDLLQERDAEAAAREKEEAAAAVEPYVYSSFRRAVPELNINGVNGGPAHGYTTQDGAKTALVYEHSLRERIVANLPVRLKELVSGERPQGSIHPVWPVIASVLTEKGVLLRQVDGGEADGNAFFAAEIETQPGKKDVHRCLVAINGDMVPPGTWEAWISKRHFKARIKADASLASNA